MAKRRENMLEAFQASAQQESKGQQVSMGGVPPPGAPSPPLAPGAPVQDPGGSLGGSAGPVPGGDAPLAPVDVGITLPMGALSFLFLQVAVLALVFLAGYSIGTDPGVGAAEGGSRPISAPKGGFQLDSPGPGRQPLLPARGDPRGYPGEVETRGPEAARVADWRAARPADAAFLDPTNRFTVRVYTADEEHTWANYEYLDRLGFEPVQPRTSPEGTVLLVGASDSRRDMQELCDRVRKIPGPNGRGLPFDTAYVDMIDKYR